jgi:NADH pyrophosphatase NudC (nudix superfamily)
MPSVPSVQGTLAQQPDECPAGKRVQFPRTQCAVIVLVGSLEPALDDRKILILRQSLVVIGVGADEIRAADAAS